MLVHRMWKGRMQKLMFQANRNGFFYVLDRETGEFLFGAPIARQAIRGQRDWTRKEDRSDCPIKNRPTKAGWSIPDWARGATKPAVPVL